MAVMNRRELIQKMLAGAAVVAVAATVMPDGAVASQLAAGRALPSNATDEFVQNVWRGHWRGPWRGHYRRRWRRRRRRWACWWRRGRRVCAWRWY